MPFQKTMFDQSFNLFFQTKQNNFKQTKPISNKQNFFKQTKQNDKCANLSTHHELRQRFCPPGSEPQPERKISTGTDFAQSFGVVWFGMVVCGCGMACGVVRWYGMMVWCGIVCQSESDRGHLDQIHRTESDIVWFVFFVMGNARFQ